MHPHRSPGEGHAQPQSSPVESITVICPACGTVYDDWFRRSLNLTIEHLDAAYVEAASSARCPSCGHVVKLSRLIVREDGVWEHRS